MDRIKVFILDDSAVVRQLLTERLGLYRNIEVVGSAIDPYVARNKLAHLAVDVLILDIEMPRMDGLTFLKYLMKYRPIPTIVLSSLTSSRNAAAIKALELGAVEVLHKPDGSFSVIELMDALVEKIQAAASVDIARISRLPAELAASAGKRILTGIATTHKIIAVGASTGGTVAMERLFREFEADFPATVAVIHMPANFTASFAKRLDDICRVHVKEAVDGELVASGTIYLAPGNLHLLIETSGAQRRLKLLNGPKIFNQRPAVDPLFRSVAKCTGKNSIGILLTGMGRDGAEGLLAMKTAGAFTIVQDEATSVVYGMPKEAMALGAASIQLPIQEIADELARQLKK